MVKRKPIEEQSDSRSRTQGPAIPHGENAIDTREVENIQACWAEAVSVLRGRSFTSFDAAQEAVVETVMNKLRVEGAARDKLRQFLLGLFETDPALQDELKRELRIAK